MRLARRRMTKAADALPTIDPEADETDEPVPARTLVGDEESDGVADSLHRLT